MNARTQRARQMMESEGYCTQVQSKKKYRVRSQTDPTKFYIVTDTGDGMVCECPDHATRNADCKHIKIALEICRKNRMFPNKTFKIMERSKLKLCRYCDSGNLKKAGFRKNKDVKIQKIQCLDCEKYFTTNFGFEKKQFGESVITGALQMYFSGMSVRDISNHYEMMGTKVSHMTIYRWVSDYSKMTSTYLNGIVPRVGDWFRADEVWVKVNGKQNYLFASMDDDTRYWLASDMADNKFQHNANNLLRMTKLQAGKRPRNFITDGLQAYRKSSRKIFGSDTNHVRHIHIAGKRDRDNNNKMERLNGEIRDREKVFRGLKRMDTHVIEGMRVYYNYTKKYGALDGQTPAQASKIIVDGKNKWKTIIQNASLNKDST